MISLGYIEDEISKLSPDFHHAAIAIESDEQAKTLIRLYTNSPDLTLEAIRAHFAESRIPNTYLPRELIHMAELPVLRTGKVDYQTLQHLIKD